MCFAIAIFSASVSISPSTCAPYIVLPINCFTVSLYRWFISSGSNNAFSFKSTKLPVSPVSRYSTILSCKFLPSVSSVLYIKRSWSSIPSSFANAIEAISMSPPYIPLTCSHTADKFLGSANPFNCCDRNLKILASPIPSMPLVAKYFIPD